MRRFLFRLVRWLRRRCTDDAEEAPLYAVEWPVR